MKKTLYAAVLFTAAFAAGGFAQNWQNGWVSRYWDACKVHCNWTGNSGGNTAGVCNRDNTAATPSDGQRSACDGGPQYVCWDHAPVVISENLAYGFVATPPGFAACGTCYEFEFTGTGQHGSGPTHAALSGKRMIVAKTNIGGDVNNNQFDLLVPGGGLGIHDAFSSQIGVSASSLGAQYGGLLTKCTGGNNSVALATAQSCLRTECNLFTNSILRDGCLFYANFMMAANNPNVRWRQVDCPAALANWYRNPKQRPSGIDGPGETYYTFQVARNPTAGGSVSVTVGGSTSTNPAGTTSHTANTSITVTAAANSGYTFQNWTAATGSLPSGFNASSASVTFSINSNVSLRANFQQSSVTPITYTLQVARNPAAGGSVSVNGVSNPTSSQSFNANASVTVTAAANSGYTFQNWTAVSGSLPSGINASSPSITFNISSNLNIRANFQQSTTPATYTLQVGRNPSAGGNVTVNGGSNNPGQSTHNANAQITIVATPNSGYTFLNWTAVSGSLPSGINANSATITFNIGANTNIRANFQQGGNPPPPVPTYTLQVGRNPSAGGNVTVNGGSNNPGQSTHDENTRITVVATANSGYSFQNWTAVSGSLPSGIDANSATITFNIGTNTNIRANFQQGGIVNPPPGGRTDTTQVEAEDYAQRVANGTVGSGSEQLRITTNDVLGITSIGWIESGNAAVYNVNMAKAGAHTLVFKVASNWDQGQSTFKVSVNGSDAGTISCHTNDWDGYTYIALNSDVQLNVGSNTIRLDFQSPVNVDYFLILGEPAPVSVGYCPPQRTTAAPASGVTLRPSARGFLATLPANHGFTSYKLIDLQGREVRSGAIGGGITDLRFNNLSQSVLILRLEGARGTAPIALRAVTY